MPVYANMEMEYEIMQRVRAYIEDNALSLWTLARGMGLTYQQLYQKIYNRKCLDLTVYMQLCNQFDVPYDYFTSDLIGG